MFKFLSFLGKFVIISILIGFFFAINTRIVSATCSINTTLRQGSRGDQVKCLQTNLKLKADGIFGKNTKAAVVAYQKSKGLTQDGIFGPRSRATWELNITKFKAGCMGTSGYSTATGQSCAVPVGCSSAIGYSIATGISCSSSVVKIRSGSVINKTQNILIVSDATISGIAVPEGGATPTSTISDTTEYTATISWVGDPITFTGNTAYTAIITITPKNDYTLTGVPADFFTVSGAIATNEANTGVVTAVFPATPLVQLTITSPTLTRTKEYDGNNTTVVTVGTLIGVVSGDAVTVSAVSTYDTANVGVGKTITTVYTLGGADALKYIKPVNDIDTTGEITVQPITVTVDSGQTKVYGEPDPIFTYTPSPALIGGDVFTGALGRTTGEDVGTYTITQNNLSAGANYSITFVSSDFEISAITISATAIAGVTPPVTGATPVTTVTAGTGYTGTVAWSPNDVTFAGATIYTATITLTPTAGYTLAGVTENQFTIAGSTSDTNPADSGVITAVFPSTSATTISATAIAGVTPPVTGATPVTTVTAGTGYTGTVAWSPNDVTFAGATIYTATITLTPTAGYTLTGVTENQFTIAGSTSDTNPADSGVITAVFPSTSATTISATAIAGVTPPVTGATPVTTVTAGTGYTGTVAWSPNDVTFAGATIYTATITLTPTAGYTLTGVTENQFTIAGSTSDTNPADSGVITAVFPSTSATTISATAIAGVTPPVTGATPVTTVTAGTGYTGTVAWSPNDVTFAGATIYTATITLTPTAGYTLTGVTENQFTIAGSTSDTNPADSGVITAVFPSTSATTISATAIAGVTPPVTGATPVTTVTAGTGYTGTVTWSPNDVTFAGATIYTATITLTPTAGYTLAGVTENQFTIAGSTSDTNPADSGVITAVFPSTSATTISATAIAGVTPPVTGATPVTTVTAGTGYTGTVAWSPNDVTFAGATIYTATITLTPTAGYTLTGVTENQFTIAGSTSDTNPADSGVITAVFPKTDPIILTDNGWTTDSTNTPTQTFGSSFVDVSGTIYLLAGGGTSFKKYDTSTKVWSILPTGPTIGNGASLTKYNNDTLYAFAGSSNKFWQYIISTQTWTEKATAPDTVTYGGSLAYPGTGDFIYGFPGLSLNSFWRYSVSNDSWGQSGVTQSNGASIVEVAGKYYVFSGGGTSFKEYDPSTKIWSTLPTGPTASNGASLTKYNNDTLYAFAGSSNKFWQYIISTQTWTEKATTPATVTYGGSLAYPGTGNFIYGFPGLSLNSFWRYSVDVNSWDSFTTTPATIAGGGAALVSLNSDTLYAFQGNNSTTFWQYIISTNTWTAKATAPAVVKGGGSLTSDGTYIYALAGNVTPAFWKYNPGDDSWTALTNTPGNIGYGGNNCYGGLAYSPTLNKIVAISGVSNGKSGSVFEYDFTSSSWNLPAFLPATSLGGGASITALNSDTLYVFRGNNSNTFWQYIISTNTWTAKATAPAVVKGGGSLTSDGTYVYALAGNATPAFWKYNPGDDSWTALTNTPGNIGSTGNNCYGGLTYSASLNALYAIPGNSSTSMYRNGP